MRLASRRFRGKRSTLLATDNAARSGAWEPRQRGSEGQHEKNRLFGSGLVLGVCGVQQAQAQVGGPVSEKDFLADVPIVLSVSRLSSASMKRRAQSRCWTVK